MYFKFNYKSYIILLKKMLNKYITKIKLKKNNGIIENPYNTNYSKNCLMMYIIEPFLDEKNIDFHQNKWQVLEFVKKIEEFGYNVDIINYDNINVKLKKKYDLIIDLHPGKNNCYKNYCNKDYKKIVYLTGSNPSFFIRQSKIRFRYLYKRKKIKMKSYRNTTILSKRDIENATSIFFIGNKYNLSTYKEFKLPPVYYIKNNGNVFNVSFGNKKKANKFLFLASTGQVQKGLDLLLDVFSMQGMKTELYICSNFKEEKDFCKLYKKELFHTKNIHAIGFLDIHSTQFIEIVEQCSYVVLPSCSEGVAGSVLTAMSAGLIPIVSKESGYNDTEAIVFDKCSIASIKKTILHYSNKNIDWIRENSYKAKYIAETYYNKNEFSKSIKEGLKNTLT